MCLGGMQNPSLPPRYAEMRSTGGRYASYWNAFLLPLHVIKFILHSCMVIYDGYIIVIIMVISLLLSWLYHCYYHGYITVIIMVISLLLSWLLTWFILRMHAWLSPPRLPWFYRDYYHDFTVVITMVLPWFYVNTCSNSPCIAFPLPHLVRPKDLPKRQ